MLRRPVPYLGLISSLTGAIGQRYFVVMFRVLLRRYLRVRVLWLALVTVKQGVSHLLPHSSICCWVS